MIPSFVLSGSGLAISQADFPSRAEDLTLFKSMYLVIKARPTQQFVLHRHWVLSRRAPVIEQNIERMVASEVADVAAQDEDFRTAAHNRRAATWK